MKKVVFASAVLVAAALAPVALGEVQPRRLRSIADSPELTRLLTELARVAQDGACLEHFGWVEEFRVAGDFPDGARILSGAEVAEEFERIAREIALPHGLDLAPFARAFEDFRTLVAGRRYRLRTQTIRADWSIARLTEFASVDGDHWIRLEIGFED